MKTKNTVDKEARPILRMFPRRGMTLAVVLLVMLVGTVFVGMSLYMAEHLHTTTQMFVARGVEYNETVQGIEIGKAWIYDQLKVNSKLPAMEAVSGDIDSADKIQLMKTTTGPLTVYVYDLNYDASKVTVTGSALTTFPPRLALTTDLTSAGGSAFKWDPYKKTFGGVSTTESSAQAIKYGTYLIRSIYSDGTGRQRTLDEALIVDPAMKSKLP